MLESIMERVTYAQSTISTVFRPRVIQLTTVVGTDKRKNYSQK